MEYANNVAKVSWSELNQRYELRVLNKLVACSQGVTMEEHATGKAELVELGRSKGYEVVEG